MNKCVLYALICGMLLPLSVFSQTKSFSSPEKLVKEWFSIIQKGDTLSFKEMQASAEIYKKIAPDVFVGKSDKEILNIINTEDDNLLKRSKDLVQSMKDFGVDTKKITISSIKYNENPLVTNNYYIIAVFCKYQATTDTLYLEAYQDNKKWYWTDLSEDANLYSIIQKHSNKSAEVVYQEGLLEKNDQKAIELFQKAIFLQKDHYSAYLQKGYRLKNMGKKIEAREAFMVVTNLNYEYAEAHWEFAMTYTDSTGTPLNGVTYEEIPTYSFQRCIDLNYRSKYAVLSLANVFFQQAKNAENQRPEDAKYIFENAEKTFTQALEQPDYSNDEKLDFFTKRGYCYRYLKEYGQALKDYERAFEISEKLGKFLSLSDVSELLWLCNEEKSYTKAIDYAKKASKNNSEASQNILFINEWAYAYKNSSNYSEALAMYENILKLQAQYPTENPKFWVNIGDCYANLSKYAKACEAYKKAQKEGTFISESVQAFLKKHCI